MAGPHPDRLKLAQTFLTQIGHSDAIPEGVGFSKDITYRVHGDHVLAGSFEGLDEVKRHLGEFFARTAGTFDAIKWEDWLVGSEHVAAVASVAMRAEHRIFTGRQIFILRFDEADDIQSVLVVPEQASPADRFFGR
jgi:hypothetical protein